MPGAAEVLDRVDAATAALRAAEDDALTWLAPVLAAWAAGQPFDTAAGLAPGWRDHARRRAQQRALAGILAALPPARSTRAEAEQVAAWLSRYEASEWRRDRALACRPDGLRGFMFDYLATGGPTSPERLRRILGHRNAVADPESSISPGGREDRT